MTKALTLIALTCHAKLKYGHLLKEGSAGPSDRPMAHVHGWRTCLLHMTMLQN